MKQIAGIAGIGIVMIGLVLLTVHAVPGDLASEPKPILFVPKTIDERTEFWQVMNQGVFAAAKEFGADVRVDGTAAETDIDGQIRLLENAISRKPRAIILAATDYYRLVPVSRKIVDSGIKLITVDSGLDGGISASFIGTDNYTAGLKAGQTLASLVELGATVAIISFVKGSATAMERERGVRDSLAKAAHLKILDTYYSDGSPEKAYMIAQHLLRSDPGVKAMIGLNEPSAVGAARAVRDSGASADVILVGFDHSTDEIAFLEEGTIRALVVQKPFNMGYLAVQTALRAIDGKKVDERIDTGSEVITKANMYTSENQKLSFPFVEKEQ